MTPITIALALVCLVFAAMLLVQRRRERLQFERLARSIEKGDRKLLGSDDYSRAPAHVRQLEHAIFEQLFTTAKLEKRVIRRDELLASLVEGLEEAVLVTGRNNNIRFANKAARNLFDITTNPVGHPVRKAIADHAILDMIDHCRLDGKRISDGLRYSGVSQGGGKDRFFEVDVAPLEKSAAGGAAITRIVLHDCTERHELEQVRRDFVANASHELRTPLTIINGYLENLLEKGVLDDRATSARFLGVMQKHGSRLARIVEDMLTISKLESDDRDTIKIEPFNFATCAREVADRLTPMIEQRRADVAIDIAPEQSQLSGDPFYWDQILFNLMENALKENEQPGLKLNVSKTDTADEHVVTVSDDGVGIPHGALPFIFKRFYRVDESHASEKTGTGLGLSIVKRAVEAHRGTIEVSSTPGQATTFTIRIPKRVA